MKQPKVPVSIVIPARNEERRLPHVLTSLLRQSVMPREIIVVNNASTDSTPAIVRRYFRKVEKRGVLLRLVNEPVQGVARARNTGFGKAKYGIIASTDADCMPDINWISRIYEHFKHCDSVAVTGTIILFDAPHSIRKITQMGWYQLLHNAGKVFLGIPSIHTANAAITKKAFDACGGFDNTIISPEDNDDFEISSRMMRFGPIRFDPSIRVSASYRRYSSLGQSAGVCFHRLQAWLSTARRNKYTVLPHPGSRDNATG